MSTVTWPGLPGGPITFSFPFSVQYIVPAWRTNNRPGIAARTPRLPVQHENGNPGAYARQDTVYLFNGAEGRQASWHATVDHTEGFANLPANEIGWHASDGAGPGNYRGFAIELSQRSLRYGTAAQVRQARKNAAEVMGRVMARLNGQLPAKMHRDFAPDRKNCPEYFIRDRAAWNQYVDDVQWFYNDEKKRMNGQDTGEKIKKGDRVKVTERLNIRQGWGTEGRVLSVLTPGTVATVINGPQYADGFTWWDVRIEGWGTGWVAGDWLEGVTDPKPDPKPQPKPTYAKPSPVPELLKTDLAKYDTAEGISTVNELEFIFVADVVEFKKASPALQYGDKASKEVKPPYQEGDRVIAAWLVKAADGEWYYVLAGEGDEWVRVRYADTIRVSDAPLLGDDTH